MAAIVPVVSTISTALGAISTVGQIYSGTLASKQQAKMYQYNADIAKQNAKLAEIESAKKEAELRRDGGRKIARQRAMLAERGVLESASGQSVLEQSHNDLEYDALNLRYQGEVKSLGLLADAKKYENSAKYSEQKLGLNLALGLTGLAK